jgi:hypothetical protein
MVHIAPVFVLNAREGAWRVVGPAIPEERCAVVVVLAVGRSIVIHVVGKALLTAAVVAEKGIVLVMF